MKADEVVSVIHPAPHFSDQSFAVSAWAGCASGTDLRRPGLALYIDQLSEPDTTLSMIGLIGLRLDEQDNDLRVSRAQLLLKSDHLILDLRGP